MSQSWKCLNCGFEENPSGGDFCSKCSVKRTGQGALTKDHPGNPVSSVGAEKRTIILSGQNQPEVGSSISRADNSCFKCSYPIPSDFDYCPNCLEGKEKVGRVSETEESVTNTSQTKATIPLSQLNAQKTESKNKNYFLVPKNFEGDHIEIKSDSPVTISRESLGDEDFSLSSKSHCSFEVINQKLILRNTSTNSAVFIGVKSETEIGVGDYIQLGSNKLFQVVEK